MSKRKKILLVEDDPNFGSILNDYLNLHSYSSMLARNGIEGLEKFKKHSFDLCIVFLTAKSLKDDIIKGFKIGADDYLIKPFDSEILLLKIKSIFKRKLIEDSKVETKELYNFSSFIYNSKFRTLKFKEEDEINLSPKESKLLQLLLQNTNDLTSREEALVKIWNDDNYFTSRSMDVYVTKIRKYLKKDPTISIENIHGKGFKLNV